MAPLSEAQSRIAPDVQRAELQSVLASTAFLRAPRHARLLTYLCDKYFAGKSDDVKEYNIATEVIGRGPDFDHGRDAIVRVEMHRLRKKLREYYETDGASRPVQIVIHPGQYVPCFVERDASTSCVEPETAEIPSTGTNPVPLVPVTPTSSRPTWRDVALVGAVVLTCAAGLIVINKVANPSTTSARTDGPTVRSVPVPMAGSESAVQILCGFNKEKYIDRQGSVWLSDRYFTGGFPDVRPRQFFYRTDDPGLFQTVRSGEFVYDIPLNAGKYELSLYFAETSYGPANSVGGGENSRVFTILLNGQMLLLNFDIINDAGGANIADIRRFKNVSPAADGKLHLKFYGARGYPLINAIQILPMAGDKQRPIRLVAQENSYTDHAGAIWLPDSYYYGGQLSTHKDVVKGTEDFDLYAGERYGNFSYAIPVDTRGRYTVNLHMAETYWGPDSPGKGGAGSRVFDVYCNGMALLRNFDIFKEHGSYRAVIKSFHGLQANAQGKLLLSFVPVTNYASVYAVEVLEE